MASCESAIREYLKQIEPTQAQKEGAQRSHNYLRDILCTGQFASRIKTSYLSGSYARETAIAPLDDVDIIFVVNPQAWQTGLLSFWPTPEAILKSFASAVRYRYGNSSVRVQRRSICLQLYHLDIDVVPAIEADSSGQMILVPTVARLLEGRGERVQESVFECHITAAQQRQIIIDMAILIDAEQDKVRYYALCGKDRGKLQVLGNGSITRDIAYWLS